MNKVTHLFIKKKKKKSIRGGVSPQMFVENKVYNVFVTRNQNTRYYLVRGTYEM